MDIFVVMVDVDSVQRAEYECEAVGERLYF
jgi:hypothetical protein